MNYQFEKYPNSLLIDLEEIAHKMFTNHASVMVGAGFSMNATPLADTAPAFPTWNQLGNHFFKKANGCLPSADSKYLNVLKLAAEAEAAIGRSSLNKLLEENIPDREYSPSPLHINLLDLPWNNVFTTNYDTLLERAAEEVFSRRYDIVVNKEDLIYANKPRIVKLHGSFPSERPYIITEEDYRSYPRKFAPFVNTVQQALLEDIFCLIGFSGDDPNFLSWIGWIRDNLGAHGTPNIYLIGVFDFSNAQHRLLAEKNIRVVNMDKYPTICGSHYKGIEAFLSFLKNKHYKTNKCEWLSEDDERLLKEDNEKVSAEKLTKIWDKKRESYPGWIVPPKTIRDRLSRTTLNGYTEKQSELEDSTSFIRLKFYFELVWRLEKALQPISSELASKIEHCLNENKKYYISGFKKQINHSKLLKLTPSELAANYIELHIHLLRKHREKGAHQKWIDAEKVITNSLSILPDESKARFYYERTLFALYSFDYLKLKQMLSDWPQNDELPFWEAKRQMIAAEISFSPEHFKNLCNSLKKIRRKYRRSSRDYGLISQELFTLKQIELVKIVHKFDYQNYSNMLAEDRQEFVEWLKKTIETPSESAHLKNANKLSSENTQELSNSLINFLDEYESSDNFQMKALVNEKASRYLEEKNELNESVEKNRKGQLITQGNFNLEHELDKLSISLNQFNFPITKNEYGFDLNTRIKSFSYQGEAPRNNAAYQYLAFNELAGLPNRICGLTIDKKDLLSAILQLITSNPYLSITTLIRFGDQEAIKKLLTREVIYKIPVHVNDNILKLLCTALQKNLTNYNPSKETFSSPHFDRRTLTIIPNVISRLVTKSSSAVKKVLFETLKLLFEMNNSYCEDVDKLTKRIMNSTSYEELCTHLPLLLQIPLEKNLGFGRGTIPHPLAWLATDQFKDFIPVEALDIEEHITHIISIAKENSGQRANALSVLITLFQLNILDEKQKIALGQLLWEKTTDKNLPADTNYYYNYLVKLPYPKTITPNKLFKTYILNTEFEETSDIDGQNRLALEILKGNTTIRQFDKHELDTLTEKIAKWGESEITKEASSSKLSLLTNIMIQFAIQRPEESKTFENDIKRIKAIKPTVQIKTAKLILEQKFDEVEQIIKSALMSPDSKTIKDGLRTAHLILMSKEDTSEMSKKQLSLLIDFISWKRQPGLTTCLYLLNDVVEYQSQFITIDSANTITSSIIQLKEYLNKENQLDFNEILEVRQACVRISNTLKRWYITKGKDIPQELHTWLNICSDENEFNEIKALQFPNDKNKS